MREQFGHGQRLFEGLGQEFVLGVAWHNIEIEFLRLFVELCRVFLAELSNLIVGEQSVGDAFCRSVCLVWSMYRDRCRDELRDIRTKLS
jgi:hypothetical protein